jgi:hypothetical protein
MRRVTILRFCPCSLDALVWPRATITRRPVSLTAFLPESDEPSSSCTFVSIPQRFSTGVG